MTSESSTLRTVLRYQLEDAFKSRWLLQHIGIYLLVTEGLILAAGAPDRALISLISVVLLLVPLGALVFGTMHLHSAREFIVLMLAQPLDRTGLFFGIYLGLVIPQAVGLSVGILLPFLLHGALGVSILGEVFVLTALGVLLTCVFAAVSLYLATRSRDRLRCIALALTVWLVMTVVYDGVVMLLIGTFSHYPVEDALIVVMALNPVDLARVVLLLFFDAAALMGYTGAVFSRFFGSNLGMAVGALALIGWITLPLIATWKRFLQLDF